MLQALIALLIGTSLLAQSSAEPRNRRFFPEGMSRENYLSELKRHHAHRIQESVGLSEDRAKALAGRWMKYLEESGKVGRNLFKSHSQFNEILRGPFSEEEKNHRLKPLLDEFLNLRAQQAELKRRFEEDARAGLSPAQQVRMIMLIEELQRFLQEGMRELRGRRFERRS